MTGRERFSAARYAGGARLSPGVRDALERALEGEVAVRAVAYGGRGEGLMAKARCADAGRLARWLESLGIRARAIEGGALPRVILTGKAARAALAAAEAGAPPEGSAARPGGAAPERRDGDGKG